MKKFRLEIIQKEDVLHAKPHIQYFDIMASNEEDAKNRFYRAAGDDVKCFVLSVKEIDMERPELAYRGRRRAEGALDNGRRKKPLCQYCSVPVSERKVIIKLPKKANSRIIINERRHLEDVNTRICYTSTPLTHCPMCNKKF